MRTENELRQAIRERADLAPARLPDLVVARPTERHTRRRVGIAIVATAAAVAAVALVPTLLRDHHSSSTAAQPTKSKVSTPVATRPAATALLKAHTWISYTGTDAIDSFDTVQAQYIELPPLGDGFQVREITAFAPGLFTKSLISNPQPITVNGVSGYFGGILPWRNDDVSHTDPAQSDPRGSKYAAPMPAVVWKIGPDQWASVVSNVPAEGNAAALTAIASRVHTNDAAIRTPIKVGYVPSGFQLSSVDNGRGDGSEPYSSEVGFRQDTKYDYPDWTVTVAPAAKPTGNSGPNAPVSMHSVYVEVHRRVGAYVITVNGGSAISKAQAKRVLASVTVAGRPASPNDSWFTLAQALS